MKIIMEPVGVVHTPFINDTPYGDYEDFEGVFFLEVFPEYSDGLYLLDRFKYVYVLFYIDRPHRKPRLRIHPPRGDGIEAGLFATRSPHRFNSIGLTVAGILKIEGNKVFTSGLDILDGTPLLDIKPYTKYHDLKADANDGWIKR